MGKLEKLEQLQKLKECGSLTDEEFKQEKEKLLSGENKKSKKAIIIILIVALLVCIAGGIYYFTSNKSAETSSSGNSKKDESGIEQASENKQASETKKLSFSSMSADDEGLSDTQKDIVNYFDYDYFSFYSKDLQRYPQIFNNAKVQTIGVVVKVLESSNDEFKVVVAQGGGKTMSGRSENDSPRIYDEGLGSQSIDDIDTNILFVLSGKQLEERLLKGDVIQMYGRYENVSNFEIDGKTYELPLVNSITTYRLSDNDGKFKEQKVKNIAEYIFSKDIKFSKIASGVEGTYYNVVLDNQSNGNFKAFIMGNEGGPILYDSDYNNLSYNITKKLWVGADFENYFVTTYDEGTKHAYLEAFNKDLKKIWSLEFDIKDNSTYSQMPIDFTKSKIAIVVDNDLYIINAETGEFLTKPILVGNKVKVNIVDDGIILIGNSNKDTIMKVSFDGEILERQDADSSLSTINSAYTQMIDNKMVICLEGDSLVRKFIIIDENGHIESNSKDLEYRE